MALEALHKHPVLELILTAFTGTKAELFVVGGAVRDALLQRPIKDLDLVVRGVQPDLIEQRLQKLGLVNLVGKRFAVFKLRLEGSEIDVALPRTDASFGTGRYRDVQIHADPQLPIIDDLKRRDFTINAMAWNIGTGELVDPYKGKKDLEQRVIRCVGSPNLRFKEDATRMLRALRFASQLQFSVEEKTLAAIRKNLDLLVKENITPRETLASELVKGFHASPTVMLDLLDQAGVIEVLLPELDTLHGCPQPLEFHAEGDAWIHTRLALAALTDPSFQKQFHSQPSAQLIITTLLHDVAKRATLKTPEQDGTNRIRSDGHAPVGATMARTIGRRLRLDSAGIDLDLLGWLIEHHLDILNFENMKATTIERTYLQRPQGELLQQLTWADGRASLDQSEVARGQQFHESRKFPVLQQRLEEIRKHGFQAGRPEQLLTGEEVMRTLSLNSGPQIGEILEAVREVQLTGTVTTKDQALAFIKKHYAG